MRKLCLALLCALPFAAGAQPAQDVAGGRDHPLVGRFQGSVLRLYRAREFDEMRMVNRPVVDPGPGGTRVHDGNSIAVAGRAVRLRYETPEGLSALEVMRNHVQRLEANRFEIVFTCRAAECGQPQELWRAVSEGVTGTPGGLSAGWQGQVYSLARLQRPEGDVYVALLAITAGRRSQVLIDVVEAGAMQSGRIAFIDASAMQRAVEQNGRVALYGIQFGFDSAEILPASRPTLDEIGRFLRANPALSVVVAGHSDSQGSFEHNVGLSTRRAQAVVAVLTREFAVPAGRVVPFGVGMASPIASNAEEAGRTQNRRVEIVRR